MTHTTRYKDTHPVPVSDLEEGVGVRQWMFSSGERGSATGHVQIKFLGEAQVKAMGPQASPKVFAVLL